MDDCFLSVMNAHPEQYGKQDGDDDSRGEQQSVKHDDRYGVRAELGKDDDSAIAARGNTKTWASFRLTDGHNKNGRGS
jgi:hypothetical protein